MIKVERIARNSVIRCMDVISESTVALGSTNGNIYISTINEGKKKQKNKEKKKKKLKIFNFSKST